MKAKLQTQDIYQCNGYNIIRIFTLRWLTQ